jgi:hypothetical protein
LCPRKVAQKTVESSVSILAGKGALRPTGGQVHRAKVSESKGTTGRGEQPPVQFEYFGEREITHQASRR